MTKVKKAKKEKVTIKGLQKQIALYEKSLGDEMAEKSAALENIENVVRKVNKLFGGDTESYHYRNSAALIKLADIPAKMEMLLGKIDGMKTKEGEYLPFINHHMQSTEMKLWYLIRVALKDDTIKYDPSMPGGDAVKAYSDRRPIDPFELDSINLLNRRDRRDY